ncbi:MAG: putative membrane protein [Chitinophagales bacterium]|jgi:putative membrane protein
MKMLNERELEQVAAAIAAVEVKTDAELVTVLARQADSYLYIPTLWAAIIALILPAFIKLLPLWLTADDLFVLQWIVFVVLALVLRWQPLMMKLVPKRVKYWRAENLARRQFLENNLHHTISESGVLIFVSAAEHYVEIIADRGIDKFIDQAQWQSIIDSFIGEVKAGNTAPGFIDCIEGCGKLLEEFVPATKAKNELPNHLVVI